MRHILAIVTGCLSLFFVFWFARLVVVTGFLMHTRAGGAGAYAGAVVFPVLAVIFGLVTARLWR